MKNEWDTRVTLLMRVKNQDDSAAWKEFVSYYRPFIHMVFHQMHLGSMEFDDLVQEILIKIWKKLPEHIYDKDRARFRTWLSRLIRNVVLNYLRANRRRDRKHAAVADGSAAGRMVLVEEPEIEDIIRKEWTLYIVKLAIERIKPLFSERSFTAFTMSMEGHSTEQIAQELGLKPNSVVKLKSRLKGRLVQEIHCLRNELEMR